MPAMAYDKAASAFMDLPLEVRHTIFEYVAARDIHPKKLLRYWFEKKEVKALIEQEATNNPNGAAPRVVYGNDYDDYDGESVVSHGEDDDEEESENAEEDSEDEDEDEDEDEEAEQEEDSESEEEVEIDAEDVEDESEEATDGEDDEDLASGHGEGNTGTVVAAAQPPPPAPVVRPHGKWRHIPNFMRLTQCPPPLQLLLSSQQLNNEAKNWFYDVATLRIDATGSFAHTSFFEEAFSQMYVPLYEMHAKHTLTYHIEISTEAAFSPMENIRKVDITFVWDSTWIRADTTDCVEAIFPALLRQRSRFVYQILLQAPDLREVIIHWHDSAQDDESTSLMLDNLAPFYTLPATVKVTEHYIAVDAAPRKRSIAGKRRLEFQNILSMGLDRLF